MNKVAIPLLVVSLLSTGAALYMGYLLSEKEVPVAGPQAEELDGKTPEQSDGSISNDADVLTTLGGGGSVADLLNHQDPKVRREAIELIAAWKPEQLKARLANTLKNESDATCRLVVLNEIGKLKVTQAFEAVLACINDKDVAVRRKAAGTLGALAGGLEETPLQKASLAVVMAIKREQAEARQLKQSASSGALFPYLIALGKFNTSESQQELLKYLRIGKDALLRRCAAQAISGNLNKSHEKALKAAWRSESDRMVRSEIEKVLAQEPFKLSVDRKRKVLVSEGK